MHFENSRFLIFQLTKREILARYRGSALGVVWSVVNPLVMLIVYTFVFSVVFTARWQIDDISENTNFALILFAGLSLHNFFSECTNRAPSLILSNINFVKKVVFPTEILSVVSVLTSLFHLIVSLVLLLVAKLLITGHLALSVVLLPMLVIPFVLGCIGISLFLSSLGVYFRDITHLTGLFTTMMLFMSPIFYPLDAVPESFQVFIRLNPLSQVYEMGRAIMVYGQTGNLIDYLVIWATSLTIFTLGYFWFSKTKTGFADVL